VHSSTLLPNCNADFTPASLHTAFRFLVHRLVVCATVAWSQDLDNKT
jgi:hypothetical protein